MYQLRLIQSIFLTVVLFSGCSTHTQEISSPQTETIENPKLYTLPVGAGNCQILECPIQNKLVVFDCGSSKSGNRGWSKEQVVKKINTLTDDETEIVVSISHTDADHHNYIGSVFSNINAKDQISTVLIGANKSQYEAKTNKWLDRPRMKVISYENGIHFDTKKNPYLSCKKDNVSSFILTVNAPPSNNANNQSMVVASTIKGTQVLFTGDMTKHTQKLINKNIDLIPVTLDETYLMTGAHHGASSVGSNWKKWADETTPKVMLYSAGTVYKHPRCKALDSYVTVIEGKQKHSYRCGDPKKYYERTDSKMNYVTDSNGEIVVEFISKDSVKVDLENRFLD